MNKKSFVIGILLGALLMSFALPVAQAIDFGSVLKVGGIGLLVDTFASQLNSFINMGNTSYPLTDDAAPRYNRICHQGGADSDGRGAG